MQKHIAYCLVFFSLLLAACSNHQKNTGIEKWAGEYSFEEEPVAANAGYIMAMEWSFSIQKQNDSLKGTLEVNGQQTFFKLSTGISGDSNSIAVTYNHVIDGSGEQLKQGDTLFILSKRNGALITQWRALEPRLSPVMVLECDCFIEMKQKNSPH
ncbi:DUF5991 domain-containing protein [Ferruginibacter sp.]